MFYKAVSAFDSGLSEVDAMQPGSLLCTSLPIFTSIERADLIESKHYKPNEHLMKRGILLYHLALERQTLESVFIRLTQGEGGFGVVA